MTFGILHNNVQGENLKEEMVKHLTLFGHFYDHKTNTAGFVFEEEDLEKFVKKHGYDPVEAEHGADLKNWSDEFVRLFRNEELFAFAVEHVSKSKIIKDNYDRFEIYKKK